MDDKAYVFTILQRRRQCEDLTLMDAYALPKSMRGKEEDLLREIVQSFLSTPEGHTAQEDTMHDFNWGDVGSYIPQHFFANYDVFPLCTNGQGPYDMSRYAFADYAVVDVNQDEVLCD